MAVRVETKDSPADLAQQERLQDILFEMQARYLVGAANVVGDAKGLYEQARVLDQGSLEQRLRFVVLAGELAGPEEAVQKALSLRKEMLAPRDKDVSQPTSRQQELAQILVELYKGYFVGTTPEHSLDDKQRTTLREELGWLGDLALHPRQDAVQRGARAAAGGAAAAIALENPHDADRAAREAFLAPAYATFATLVATVLAGGVLGLGGLVGLIIFLVLLANRKLHAGITCGSTHGGVYAETFALFLLLFIGLSLGAQAIPGDVPLLVRSTVVALGTLVVLGWPVLRGIAWTQVRHDIGWTLGREPVLEPAAGLACYVIALPIVAVGLVVSLLLMSLRNQLGGLGLGMAQNQPVHPIVEFIVHGSASDRVLVFIDACILAPIMEETMFRGFLYRHLRELTCRSRWIVSFFVSAALTSFLFAAIHPQGLVAVPVLMALAFGFTIAREWRGSLIPCMVAHGFNNGMVILFILLAMGD